MNFGEALHALKNGQKVEREGWNGKGMFIYHVDAGAYPATSPVAKAQWGEELVPYTAYLAIKSVNGTVSPWLASQTDVLADDWRIVDAFDEWAEGLAEEEPAPTGVEGRVGKSIALDLDDAKAVRDYLDMVAMPTNGHTSQAIKTLHWLITDAEA
jgi:hypothetical protein